uniref:Uncharacterized protein n=1 Tax=Elaeophora elaphi TaxID=1147741 RepID=A0A0R3RZN3_9BILA
MRSVSPVRSITPVEPHDPIFSSKNTSWCPSVKEGNNNHKRLNRSLDGYRPITPIPTFDTLPASIPRIEISKTTTNALAPRSHYNITSTFYEHSPRSDDSCGHFSHSTYSGSGDAIPSGNAISVADFMVPLKKVTKESRWISVHDGRPVSPYVKTVAYVPKYSDQECILNTHDDRNYHYNNECNLQPK